MWPEAAVEDGGRRASYQTKPIIKLSWLLGLRSSVVGLQFVFAFQSAV